jgi:hypothetical protein
MEIRYAKIFCGVRPTEQPIKIRVYNCNYARDALFL